MKPMYRGFTLLEITIVAAIAALLALGATAMHRIVARERANAELERLRGIIALARNAAIRTAMYVYVDDGDTPRISVSATAASCGDAVNAGLTITSFDSSQRVGPVTGGFCFDPAGAPVRLSGAREDIRVEYVPLDGDTRFFMVSANDAVAVAAAANDFQLPPAPFGFALDVAVAATAGGSVLPVVSIPPACVPFVPDFCATVFPGSDGYVGNAVCTRGAAFAGIAPRGVGRCDIVLGGGAYRSIGDSCCLVQTPTSIDLVDFCAVSPLQPECA